MSTIITRHNGAAAALSAPAVERARGMDIDTALATLARVKEFAEALAASDFIPACHRGKPGNIIAAIFMGQAVGLGPLQALQGIAVINGRPSLYGDALLAVVRAHPEFEDIEEKIERSADGEGAIATCTVKRRGQTPVVRTFSQAQAKHAGLWGKAGPWQQYPARMLQMRARGFACRDSFPDALQGMISAEEAEDISREPRDVTPREHGGNADILAAVQKVEAPLAPALPADTGAQDVAPAPAQQQPVPVEAQPQPQKPTIRTPAQLAAMEGARLGLTDEEQRRVVEAITGRSSRRSITEDRLPLVIAQLKVAAERKRHGIAPAAASTADHAEDDPGAEEAFEADNPPPPERRP